MDCIVRGITELDMTEQLSLSLFPLAIFFIHGSVYMSIVILNAFCSKFGFGFHSSFCFIVLAIKLLFSY